MKINLSRARRGVLSVASGTAAGQAIAALSAPVLTRLFSPEEFGAYSFILALTMIFGTVAALRLEFAVPLTADADEARGIVRTASTAVAVSSVVVAIGVGVLLLGGLDQTGISAVSWSLLPLLVALTGYYALFSQVALREQAYTVVGVRALVQNGGTAAGQFLLSLLTRSAAGLLGGQVIGRILALIGLTRTSRPYFARTAVSHRAVLTRYSTFPLMLAPSALFNLLGTYLPLLIVTHAYGNTAAGNFGVAQQVVLLPAGLVGTAVGQVFIGEFSSRLRDGHGGLTAVANRASRTLSALAVVFTLGVLLFSGPAFPWVFGARWDTADDFARAMAVSVGIGIVVSPLSFLLLAMERAKEVLALDVARVVVVGGAGLASVMAGMDAVSATWVMFAGQALIYIATWLAALRAVWRHDATVAAAQAP